MCYVTRKIAKSIMILRAIGVEEGEVELGGMTIRWYHFTSTKRTLEMIPWSCLRWYETGSTI